MGQFTVLIVFTSTVIRSYWYQINVTHALRIIILYLLIWILKVRNFLNAPLDEYFRQQWTAAWRTAAQQTAWRTAEHNKWQHNEQHDEQHTDDTWWTAPQTATRQTAAQQTARWMAACQRARQTAAWRMVTRHMASNTTNGSTTYGEQHDEWQHDRRQHNEQRTPAQWTAAQRTAWRTAWMDSGMTNSSISILPSLDHHATSATVTVMLMVLAVKAVHDSLPADDLEPWETGQDSDSDPL